MRQRKTGEVERNEIDADSSQARAAWLEVH
jgi:hypothetical protein